MKNHKLIFSEDSNTHLEEINKMKVEKSPIDIPKSSSPVSTNLYINNAITMNLKQHCTPFNGSMDSLPTTSFINDSKKIIKKPHDIMEISSNLLVNTNNENPLTINEPREDFSVETPSLNSNNNNNNNFVCNKVSSSIPTHSNRSITSMDNNSVANPNNNTTNSCMLYPSGTNQHTNNSNNNNENFANMNNPNKPFYTSEGGSNIYNTQNNNIYTASTETNEDIYTNNNDIPTNSNIYNTNINVPYFVDNNRVIYINTKNCIMYTNNNNQNAQVDIGGGGGGFQYGIPFPTQSPSLNNSEIVSINDLNINRTESIIKTQQTPTNNSQLMGGVLAMNNNYPPSTSCAGLDNSSVNNKCYCHGCTNTDDCGVCSVCLTMHKFGGPFFKTSKRCLNRVCIYSNKKKPNQLNAPVITNNQRMKGSSFNSNFLGGNNVAHSLPMLQHVSQLHPYNNNINTYKQPFNDNFNRIEPNPIPATIKKTPPIIPIKFSLYCLGKGCKNPATYKSKYCSKICGMKTNIERVRERLRKRVVENNYDLSNESGDYKKIQDLNDRLQVLSNNIEYYLNLRLKLIDYYNTRPILSHEYFPSSMDIPFAEAQFMCPCCHVSIGITQATKHVARCFNRVERIYSYVSPVPSNEYFICDKIMKKPSGYCKRLFSNCVDHRNMEAFKNNVICGFFLEKDNKKYLRLDDNNDNIDCIEVYNDTCNIPRDKCYIHFGWERSRLASVEQTLQNLCQTRSNLMKMINTTKCRMKNRQSIMSAFFHKIPT